MTVEPAQRELAAVSADDQQPAAAAEGRWLAWAQQAAVVVALVVWARVVTGRAGGRDDGALLLGCLSLLPSILLLRPDVRALLPLLTLVTASLSVCLLSPLGFAEAQVIGVAAYTGGAFAVVRAFASTPERRLAVATALCLVSLDQFAQGFLAWWGGENPARPMIGTFFWHNQYAAFLLPGVMLGAGLAVFATRIHRVVGFLSAAVCLAGVVYSTSRASMILAAAGLVVLLVVAAGVPDRRTRLPLAAALVALAAGATFFFTSAVFFQGSASPVAGTAARGQAETLEGNTSHRIQFWQAAVHEFADRPLVGAGFGSYGELSGQYLPPAAVRTFSAHNEFLQALAEGGLLWAIPVLGLSAAACLAALRRLRGRWRAHAPDRAVMIGAALGLGALTLHAAVDFDWSYPSLAVTMGVVAGLVLAVPRLEQEPRPVRASRPARQSRALAAGGACLALVLGAQAAQAQEATSRSINGYRLLMDRSGPQAAADAVLSTRSWFRDPRIDAIVLKIGLKEGVGSPLALSEGVLRRAVTGTRDYARVKDGANADRAAVMLALGQQDQALRDVREMAELRAHSRPATLEAYAVLLTLTGSRTEAIAVLAGTIVRRGEEARTTPDLGAQLYTLYRQLSKIAPHTLELRCAGAALAVLDLQLDPSAPPLARSGASDSCEFLREKGWT